MASIPIFGYLPMRKDTCSQWHSTCFPPDPAHPTVPGASDSSAMGVSPMLSRVGSLCRATGAVKEGPYQDRPPLCPFRL